jgi:peptide/nickel transport system ATP-binding protein
MSFGDVDLRSRPETRIPRNTAGISMVFQDAMTSLDPVWTVGSQLTSLLRTVEKCSRRAAKDRAREWLTKVGLTDTARVLKARPYELSGGMRQRVMMALALCSSPRLLIADEPTSALDASLSRTVMELMVELTEQAGTALLIVSHDLNLCLEYTDRVLVMYRSRIVEQGPSAEIQRDPQHPYTKALLSCIPTLESVNRDRLPTLSDFLTPAGAGELVVSG